MPDDRLSKVLPTNPFVKRGSLTFADVMARLLSDTALPATRRRDLLSSVRCLIQLMEVEPTTTPASLGAIRARLRRFHPAQANVSKKRFANIKADVAFALRHLGVTSSTLRNGKGLGPAWQVLWASVEDEQTRWKLSRLFRFCSASNVEPDEVSDATIEELLRALIDESFVKDPEATIRQTIYAWNLAGKETEGWPPQLLSKRKSRREAWTIPLTAFPDSFQRDVDAWLRHLSGDDPLADDGVPRPLRPATLDHRAYQIRNFAAALVRRNVPMEQITGLDVLLEVENYREALRFMLDRHDGVPTEAIYNCAMAMKAVAKHHVKVAKAQLDELALNLCPHQGQEPRPH